MRPRGRHDRHVQLTRLIEGVHVATAAGQQAIIFDPRERAADILIRGFVSVVVERLRLTGSDFDRVDNVRIASAAA